MVERLTPAELRTLFLFEDLDDDQLSWLAREGWVRAVDDGVVYSEGEPGVYCYVLLSGAIAMSKRFGRQDVELNRSDRRGVYAGAFHALYGDPKGGYSATMRVIEPSRFFVLEADTMFRMIRAWLPMAVHLIQGVVGGMRRTNSQLGQRERLMALGSLSAGLTHELNNPASAAVEAVASLRERLDAAQRHLDLLADGTLDPETMRLVVGLRREAVAEARRVPVRSPLALSDAQDELSDWLEDHGVADGWDLAPVLVGAGLDVTWAEGVLAAVGAGKLDGVVRWLAYSVDSDALLGEIDDSAKRISSLIGAAKAYSQLDRTPLQLADLHVLLDSTLTVLTRRLAGIEVVRDYDPALPKVEVYAAELNQVWTNIVENAIDAMGGAGTLTVRTGRDRDRALVEFGDTGPGIPPEHRSRVFEPFFTTKPVGEGTGLGLDLAWRVVVDTHHGDLQVVSEPGDTRFRVWLPLRPTD